MAGWIKISRDIQSHWIYQDSEKLKWWIDLLLLANFEDKKVTIKFRVFDCKRGQLLYSLKTLSQRWNVSKSVVNNFLEMLRKQNMIETENETVTTRITICNYDTYQQIGNANETETKRKQNANETQVDTTKEYKESKEVKETKEIYLSFDHLAISLPEYNKLIEAGYSKIQIDSVLGRIQNYAKNKKYKSLYLTALDWLKKDNAKITEKLPVVEKPKINPYL